MRRLAAGGPDIQAERQVFTFPGAESDPLQPDGLLRSGRWVRRLISEFRFHKQVVEQSRSRPPADVDSQREMLL